MLCVLILYISAGSYGLKSTPNDRFFEKLFKAILFTFQSFNPDGGLTNIKNAVGPVVQ